jgi:hypothetical protein
MMGDLIDRKTAIETVRKCAVKEVTPAYMLIDRAEAMTELMMLPPAQHERKKGRWIVIVRGFKLTSYKCSECGRYIVDDTGYDVKKDYPFCNCGADMKEGTDDKRRSDCKD